MRIVRGVGVRLVLLGVLVVALTVLPAACGGSSTGSTGATASTTLSPLPALADADTIAANYVKFFDGARSAADKIGLLENGHQYANELEAQAASSLGKTVSITISSVTPTSTTSAAVKFSILISGRPTFSDQTGKAILQDGVWKVGAETFLAFLALQQGSTTQTS